MDADAIAAGLEDYATPNKSFPFAAAAGLTVVDSEGRQLPLPSLYDGSAKRRTIVVFGRNML
jgi:hypothetical protein